MAPGEISIVLGPLLRVKLKSGGASGGGVVVVLELTELDWIEDVEALEDVELEDVALEDVEVREDVALEDVVVLTEDAVCAGLG